MSNSLARTIYKLQIYHEVVSEVLALSKLLGFCIRAMFFCSKSELISQ